MSRRSKEKPSFFKVVSNIDFTDLLRVAPSFFQKYGITPPEKANLRVHSGRTWIVKVERLDNGLFCFTDGWPNFAHDCGLQLGEFLVFTLLRKSNFKVAIYDTSFCEREIRFSTELISNSHGANMNQKRKRSARDAVGGWWTAYECESSNPLYLEISLKEHHRSRVNLRKKFWAAAGLHDKKWVKLEYVGNNGRCSSAELDHRQKYRIELTRGWNEFRKANGLRSGKTYSFRFIPNKDIIHVDEVVRNTN